MIEKERLEDLIEQMADIYVVMHFGVYTHKLTREYKLGDYGVGVVKYGKVTERWAYEDLFETKEDAEEYAEFGNITKTERLELPSWEDIPNEVYLAKFIGKDKNEYHLLQFNSKQGWILFNDTKKKIVEKFIKRTRENYNEARRLCVKLFRGEEV